MAQAAATTAITAMTTVTDAPGVCHQQAAAATTKSTPIEVNNREPILTAVDLQPIRRALASAPDAQGGVTPAAPLP
jgi:hypothetical protein